MSTTTIEWTDRTWNPVRGCSRVSEGCRHCYAERQAARFSDPGQYAHGFVERTPSGPRWTGRVELVPEKLEGPLRWSRPSRVFVNSMSDLFHESLPDEAIDRVLAVMAVTRWHTYQVLTKRPQRMRAYLEGLGRALAEPSHLSGPEHRWDRARRRLWERSRGHERERIGVLGACPPWPLPNVWLGVSVEDQATADERIPHLLATPAAVRFVSAEPLLGPVDLAGIGGGNDWLGEPPGSIDKVPQAPEPNGIDWVIVGGESGPGARPCDVDCVREIVAQCRAAGVACFVKQIGSDPGYRGAGGPGTHSPIRVRLRDPKGGDPAEWPEDLRVREFPQPTGASASGATGGR